ncbi:DUF488 domain-containing protein [Paractinoplanes toevensis]|uniref:DUF488 domain-containing protein n=1 Tax=Paractinoplanes toevensis TaxID=571911 RepID=UPI001FECADE0|nr:DUF488 domain-containing protein [Actinoplanes toevensis]
MTPGLVGVGYEGLTVGELVARLRDLGVTRLVDVRLTPISRKPGLSKTALGRELAAAGIVYEHRRELGNPKSNRAGFASEGLQRADARRRYVGLLGGVEASGALDALTEAGRLERVAVLCFEAEQDRCHRDVVLAQAQRRLTGGPAPNAEHAEDVCAFGLTADVDGDVTAGRAYLVEDSAADGLDQGVAGPNPVSPTK